MKRSHPLLWILMLSLSTAPSFAQQDADPNATMTLHVSTRLVLLDASVLNKKTGERIGDLTLDDLSLSEDKQPQKLTYLSVERLPLSLVFLFDITETVHPILKPLSAAAQQVLSHLHPDDEVAVMVFSSHTTLLQDFTTDHTLIEQAIAKAADAPHTSQPTHIYQDVIEATRQSLHSTLPNGRRVQVWLTDGTANAESSSPAHDATDATTAKDQASRQLLHTDIVVSALIEHSGATDALSPFILLHLGGRFGDIARYADLTGGPVLHTTRSEVADRFAALLDAIRQRYTIGYKPSGDHPPGTFCHLRFSLSPSFASRHPDVPLKDIVVRARQSCFQ
jgi:VWFA-related protein